MEATGTMHRFLSDPIEHSGALIFVKDRDGLYTLVNRKWEAVTGLQRDKVLGRTDEELFPGEIGRQFRRNDREAMESGTVLEKEEILDGESGRRYFLSIKMDPSQIDQILANLCANARDAIDSVGRIIIATGNIHVDDAFCLDREGCREGDFVVLSITDTGCGMDRETRANLFEPFYTTKEVGKGTGLGLAMVYGIVQQNNGFVTVDRSRSPCRNSPPRSGKRWIGPDPAERCCRRRQDSPAPYSDRSASTGSRRAA
jgi:PAS domain S-box-containing protein